MLSGAGGNIAILEGEDGLLLVDSGLPATVEGVLAETGRIGTGHIARLINTHYHFDHTGGNERMGADGAKILAHASVRARLTTKQTNPLLNRTFEPLAAEGLPSETFTGPGHLAHGGERVEYRCLPPAHTDSDTVVVFANANVHHAGDLYFYGTYPLIDYSVGGSLAAMAAEAESLWKSVDGASRIIPGHGPLSDKNELKGYADMLAASLEIMNQQLQAGKTLEQMLAARPFQYRMLHPAQRRNVSVSRDPAVRDHHGRVAAKLRDTMATEISWSSRARFCKCSICGSNTSTIVWA